MMKLFLDPIMKKPPFSVEKHPEHFYDCTPDAPANPESAFPPAARIGRINRIRGQMRWRNKTVEATHISAVGHLSSNIFYSKTI
jgi:hypothetical protein